jgi:phosphoglycolate phosphatase
VLLPAGVRHQLTNTGESRLTLLCACAPPYCHEDTVITEQRIRLVIFDFDGTLVNSAPGIQATANVLARRYGRPPVTRDEVIRAVGRGLDRFIEVVFPEALKNRTVGSLMTEYRRVYAKKYKVGLVLLPRVRETIKTLKRRGVKLAIVSNKHRPAIIQSNRLLGIDRYFDTVLGVESLKRRKPDPAPLRFLMNQFGATPQETLMVGDSQVDVETGKRAGVRTVFLTGGYADARQARKLKPDHIFRDIGRVLKIV